jgi:sugar O-acyltransferase (sialic acid O-acetyltransferase NeuD family)
VTPVTQEAIDLLIYGAGGYGREVEWLASECFRYDAYDEAHATGATRCFIDDVACSGELCGVPVMSLADAREWYPDAAIIVAIGSPHIRQRIAEAVEAAGGHFATLLHPDTRLGPRVCFGAGTMICAGNILTTDIRIGRHVIVNLACTIGHDVLIEDYATVSPGVHISGNVHIGARAFIGTGAVINNGLPGHPIRIGRDCVIGAGAVVREDIPDGCTAVGVPAKVIRRGTAR